MKQEKSFDCVEMKRRIQSKIYAETKNMSRDEFVDYMRKHVEEGPFAQYMKKVKRQKV